MAATGTPNARLVRKPAWLKVRAPGGERYTRLKGLLRGLDLHTVCEEARCPNVGECWGGGTATIMLLGDVCTRGCRFCAVTTGSPGGRVDRDEPRKVARALATLDLDYVVLTSVDRDDLPDQGAAHFAETVREIKRRSPHMLVEVLTPDFTGDRRAIETIAGSGADVLAHNVEVVRRLQRSVRDVRCGYDQSLAVLEGFKRAAPKAFTKSSIMLGLGETGVEVAEAMRDLRAAGVDFLTLGQYLRPSPRHAAVHEYVPPSRFDALRREGERLGFEFVAAGPLVRSSYRAGEFFIKSRVEARRLGREPGAEPGDRPHDD